MHDNDTIRDWLENVPDKLLQAEAAKRNVAKRKVHSGGDTTKLRPCPKCGVQMGHRALVKHKPKCGVTDAPST